MGHAKRSMRSLLRRPNIPSRASDRATPNVNTKVTPSVATPATITAVAALVEGGAPARRRVQAMHPSSVATDRTVTNAPAVQSSEYRWSRPRSSQYSLGTCTLGQSGSGHLWLRRRERAVARGTPGFLGADSSCRRRKNENRRICELFGASSRDRRCPATAVSSPRRSSRTSHRCFDRRGVRLGGSMCPPPTPPLRRSMLARA